MQMLFKNHRLLFKEIKEEKPRNNKRKYSKNLTRDGTKA